MMSQLIHAVSRVRAMESQLLTSNAVERMISAESFNESYSVLDDLGYAEESSYFRENKDFEGVLEMGLYASSQIFKSFGLEKTFKICTVLWDIQNISLAIKAKEIEQDEDIVKKTMIPYSFYSIEDIIDAVFHDNGNIELLSLLRPCSRLSSLREKENYISSTLFENAKKEIKGNVFLTSFFENIQSSENIKKDILNIPKDSLLKKYPHFSKIISLVFQEKSEKEKIIILETLLDERMVSFLKNSSLGVIDGLEPLFSFFWRKERNARVIRSILLAKRAGISSQEIRKDYSSFIF